MPSDERLPASLQLRRPFVFLQAMSKAAREKTELLPAPKDSSARGSWQTATAGMYTAEGLAALRSSQAFTPKPSAGSRERERRIRGGAGGGDLRGGSRGGGQAGNGDGERVFAGDEAEVVHEAGQQGDLREEVGGVLLLLLLMLMLLSMEVLGNNM